MIAWLALAGCAHPNVDAVIVPLHPTGVPALASAAECSDDAFVALLGRYEQLTSVALPTDETAAAATLRKQNSDTDAFVEATRAYAGPCIAGAGFLRGASMLDFADLGFSLRSPPDMKGRQRVAYDEILTDQVWPQFATVRENGMVELSAVAELSAPPWSAAAADLVHTWNAAPPVLACPLPTSAADADWQTAPMATATNVDRYQCEVDARHPGDATLSTRDQLWSTYAGWLAARGYTPARANHHEPWNEVRWQRFARGEQDVELQIRRPDHANDWLVMLIPKVPGSLW